MGWQGHEIKIPVGMLFKKMYCFKCGNKLDRKEIRRIIKKGDPNYSNDIMGHSTIGMDRKEQVEYIYICPNCHLEITYKEQCVISDKQKESHKKILDVYE